MKIVWISHSGGIGGAEISLCEATKGLIMNGHENHVFLPTIGPLSERLVQIRATVEVSHHLLWMHTGDLHRPQYYKLRRLFKHLKSGLLISTRLKEILPDLVVTNTITTPAGAIAAKLLALPHVWYIREFGREDHGAIFDYGTRLSHFLMDKLSKRIIVNSNAVKCKYVNLLPKSKIDLVYNAVDVPLPAFNNNVEKTDSTCNLLVMGRIAPGKRQEDAILALNHLRSQGHKVTLTLVGNQDESYIHYLYSLVQMYRLNILLTFVR